MKSSVNRHPCQVGGYLGSSRWVRVWLVPASSVTFCVTAHPSISFFFFLHFPRDSEHARPEEVLGPRIRPNHVKDKTALIWPYGSWEHQGTWIGLVVVVVVVGTIFLLAEREPSFTGHYWSPSSPPEPVAEMDRRVGGSISLLFFIFCFVFTVTARSCRSRFCDVLFVVNIVIRICSR